MAALWFQPATTTQQLSRYETIRSNWRLFKNSKAFSLLLRFSQTDKNAFSEPYLSSTFFFKTKKEIFVSHKCFYLNEDAAFRRWTKWSRSTPAYSMACIHATIIELFRYFYYLVFKIDLFSIQGFLCIRSTSIQTW